MKNWNQNFSEAVRADFEKAKSQNSRLSLRSYAKRIETPVSTVSYILKGDFSMTSDRAAQIVNVLAITAREKQRLLALIEKPVDHHRKSFNAQQESLITDWSYLAVLHFFDLENTEKTPEALSARLALPLEKIHQVLNDLKKLNLIKEFESGELIGTSENWQSADEIPSETIRQHHKESLTLAIKALQKPIDERDITSSIVTGNRTQIGQIKSEIRKFHQKIAALLEGSSPRDQIFNMTIAFFNFDKMGDLK